MEENLYVTLGRKEFWMTIAMDDKQRFERVRDRAERLGVLDMNFSGVDSADSLDCYERTLDIIEKNKERFDRNKDEV